MSSYGSHHYRDLNAGGSHHGSKRSLHKDDDTDAAAKKRSVVIDDRRNETRSISEVAAATSDGTPGKSTVTGIISVEELAGIFLMYTELFFGGPYGELKLEIYQNIMPALSPLRQTMLIKPN